MTGKNEFSGEPSRSDSVAAAATRFACSGRAASRNTTYGVSHATRRKIAEGKRSDGSHEAGTFRSRRRVLLLPQLGDIAIVDVSLGLGTTLVLYSMLEVQPFT